MELSYDPLWDESGELRRGCTVREALAWLTQFGGHTAGETVSVNGVIYKAGHLLYGPNRPDIAELSREITKGLRIVYVKTMEEVVREAFV